MIWNKPKKTIINLLVIVSLISLIISILSIITFLLWTNNPRLIHSIGEKIPSTYVKDIETLYKNATNEKNLETQYQYYKKLNIALDGISALDRFYITKQKTYKFLINYYDEKKDSLNALKVAKAWMEQNNYDYDAKLYYANALAKVSTIEAKKYYNTLYTQHKEIPKIAKQYIHFLINNQQLNKAAMVEDEFNQNNTLQISPKFKLYYLNKENHKYANQYSLYINDITKQVKNTYELKLSKNFNFLSALRFDIDNIHTGTTIKNIKIQISTQDTIYDNLQIVPINNLEKTTTNEYITLGTDPFFYINLPEQIKLEKSSIDITIRLELKYQLNIAEHAQRK